MDNGYSQPNQSHVKATISLDGRPVTLPMDKSAPLNFVRCHIEALALTRHRVLSRFSVDGLVCNLAFPLPAKKSFSRIEAVSIPLEEGQLLVLKTAWQQTHWLHENVEKMLTWVLINEISVARSLWWDLAWQLKEPVLTLSLLPENLCDASNPGASFMQLRKWQLEQVGAIIQEVNQVCNGPETIPLSDTLENRVLPWLDKLADLIQLWHETVLAAARLGLKS
jgi:hypothetical protein